MIMLIHDKMPHVNLPTNGALSKNNIRHAYEDITTAYNGINDFVNILDRIYEGVYSLSEVITAGIIATNASDGYFKNGRSWERAKYIRINGNDTVFLMQSHNTLAGDEIAGCEFDSDNGEYYKFKPQKLQIHMKMRIDCSNNQPSEDV